MKISASLVHRYMKSGWVERIARGVYMFAGDTLQRDDCLAFLAEKLPGFHVGGKTALAWRGMGHNLPAQERLMLWGKRNTKLPAWFADRFAARYTVRDLYSEEVDEAGLQPLPEQAGGVPVSVPERALLEMLSEVGVHQEIGEARDITEGVRSLRVKVLAKFLAACRQEKAARLCVLWGEELSLPWAGAARAAVGDRFGKKRWVKRMDDGSTLVLKP